MAERTTSRAEADLIKRTVDGCIKELERSGFDRGQIGAAMAGISLAMVQVHVSSRIAIAMCDQLKLMLEGDAATKQ